MPVIALCAALAAQTPPVPAARAARRDFQGLLLKPTR